MPSRPALDRRQLLYAVERADRQCRATPVSARRPSRCRSSPMSMLVERPGNRRGRDLAGRQCSADGLDVLTIERASAEVRTITAIIVSTPRRPTASISLSFESRQPRARSPLPGVPRQPAAGIVPRQGLPVACRDRQALCLPPCRRAFHAGRGPVRYRHKSSGPDRPAARYRGSAGPPRTMRRRLGPAVIQRGGYPARTAARDLSFEL